MHASKLLKPLVATVLAVVAFGATAPAAHAGIGVPGEPATAVAAADLPPGPGAVGPEF